MSIRLMTAKRLWVAAGIVAAAAALAYYLVYYGSGGAAAKLSKKDGLLVLSGDKAEIAFNAGNGGIAYIKEKSAAGNLAAGSGDGALWWAFLSDDSAVNAANADSFDYDWDGKKGILTFRYGGKVEVEVTAGFGEDGRLSLNAAVANGADKELKLFRFPNGIKVDSNEVKDGLLPMLPGAKLKDAFFKESNSFADQYPGVMFASYVGVRTNAGNLSVYDIGGKTTVMTELGFKNQIDDPGTTGIVHNYKTWIKPNANWHSPTVVLDVGSDYPAAIAGYREANGIGGYRSLEDKLGEDKNAYFALPLYKTDISAIKDASWNGLTSNAINKMNYPGIIHLVGFQTGGHDENYPDFVPPDPKWGGDDAFRRFVGNAQEKGNKVVPYTNMSWWGIHSPTLANLPSGTSMDDLVVVKEGNQTMKEDYGAHSGYVVNTGHPFFKQRTAEEHKKLTETAGFDGAFEDQWGIRNSPYVFNETIPAGTDPSTAYFQGVRDYFDALTNKTYIEDGTDALADDAVGFMGSTYLWDILGYRKNTATYTDYYPLSGMLLRDKVMFYQHNLAGETMTDDQAMLRWNVAMGYNLSADFYNGVGNPWVDATGVFQKYALSGYADSLVVGYEQLTPTATRTDFGTRKATANWDDENAYVLDGDTSLAPGGFDVRSEDGAVRAGNYSRYNGLDLDPGDHDLVETRSADAVRVYQPIGSDATLRIKKGDGWPHVSATAYEADGAKIADWPVKEEGDFAVFDYIASVSDRKVGYIELKSADAASSVDGSSYRKAKLETNVAAGMGVKSTSMTAEAFKPENAVDGDPFTYWESTAKKFPQAITVDLGEEKPIGKLKLRLPPQDAWESRDQEVEVLGSADGETFVALSAAKPYTFDPKQDNVAEIPLGDVRTRFVQVRITGNTAWPAAQVSELEVY